MKLLLEGVGPELSPEMMIAALQARQRVIEVPVSYHRRVSGESKHSANYLHISRTALRMLRTIARKRLGAPPRRAHVKRPVTSTGIVPAVAWPANALADGDTAQGRR
jgi:hypothetical protein